jgi:glycosyltransferase involved in cell wall biosynthesis
MITTRGSAFGKIAGTAPLLVNPPDDFAIANALELVLHNSELRRQLSEAGLKRRNQFSFVETAKQTIRVTKQLPERRAQVEVGPAQISVS